VIAYLLLLKANRPMTESELDAEAENLLNQHFENLEVDFEVDDALEKITIQVDQQGQEMWNEELASSTMFVPLVQAQMNADGELLYMAKPLAEALRVMDHKWDNFFQYN
jgi:hypothetical protein